MILMAFASTDGWLAQWLSSEIKKRKTCALGRRFESRVGHTFFIFSNILSNA
jgi:hypothetical protein